LKGVSKEFKIGTIVLISMVLLVVGVNYLKGISLFINQRTFYAVYENVDGLGPANPVVLNGFKVGQVKTVGFHPKGDGTLLVSFIVDKDELKVPLNTKARIISSDLFGSKAIELLLGDTSVMAMKNDTLPSEIEIGIAEAVRIELVPLKKKTDQLIEGVDDILNNLQAFFADDATQGLPKVFESLQRTMENLETTSYRLDNAIASNSSTLTSIFNNVDSITDNLRANNARISNIVRNLDSVTDSLARVDLAATLTKADRALGDFAEVMDKVNNGDGSIAMLINTDSLHQSLIQTNLEVQYLINDLYMNPWRYVSVSVFGKKPKDQLSKKELKQIQEIVDAELKAREASEQ
jgi:phospholipid/cholesterol/gamma-HCH transport system substrate-binding protein